MNHPNIIRFIGAGYDSSLIPMWILTEFAPKGSLENLISKSNSGLNLDEILQGKMPHREVLK